MSRPSLRKSSSTRTACATISGPMPSPGNTAIFMHVLPMRLAAYGTGYHRRQPREAMAGGVADADDHDLCIQGTHARRGRSAARRDAGRVRHALVRLLSRGVDVDRVGIG